MYTTDIQDSGTVSATDEERLPPGGFSLRHGFPEWFGRGARRSAERVRTESSLLSPTRDGPTGSSISSPESGVDSTVNTTPGHTSVRGTQMRKGGRGIY